MTSHPATNRRLRTTAALLAPLALAAGLLAGCSHDDPSPSGAGQTAASATPTSSATFTKDANGSVTGVTYPGKDGMTALELLLAADPYAQVSGSKDQAFVTGIGGRTADDSKKEFWALSVDGKEAQVGAGALETKDGETITWKLTTY
ncbi:DUF4430 domain-containing protein [Luteimicrobium subarcticum]|uniref:Uncharacterized protein DUF4430 n=1 Tax=Luteimicrobium subarcticum TaxID=620910 RepID=A0A2M8WRF7_9MICO|nr:DUF4430 domain-containing protein [Luteimicrobium subarcticum]PJI93513.1 uncharacterized protein DUF4430 [Luteimicrobium subarcticum]